MKISIEEMETLCRIADAASQAIMEVYRSEFTVWEKDDNSPLTEADLRSDAIIRAGLEQAFKDVFILSEESSSSLGSPETFFLVDPLDGTKEFLKRNDEFTVNIALVHQGRPIAGVVAAPALEERYWAAEGLGAFKRQGEDITALSVAKNNDSLRVIGSRSHGGGELALWLEKLTIPYTFVPAGSSLKFCRIAEGQADIYPRFGLTSQWDTAAAQCVVEQAGGCVADMAGTPLRYGLDRPILNPHFVAANDRSLFELFSG